MKIHDILQSLKGAGKTTGKATGGDFQQLLAGEIGNTLPPATAGVSAATAATAAIPAGLRLQGLELTETTLSTLDSFSAALGNTALKTEELEPFVAALEEDVAALRATREQMPPTDPLAKLLDRVATVSYLETAKFRRGDYA